MAIKSRLLSKLKSTYVTMNMAATSHPQKMHPVLHNLMEAKTLCQQGLTEENFAKYGEVYDGLIMAIRQILSGEAGKDAGEIVGLCKELLEHIVLETSREEHFKKEMVFLPYKASMWDSLESVWRAAYEDKDNCLTYVIPIPYCDRNPDGTAKEWHCERDLFPKDVPTLDWQEVDLKHMHPDVIFYHYPYDNCNRVTSQDEAYYSSNLKECADKLVYIPYYVLPEPEFDYDDPELEEDTREKEDKFSNVILEPGVTNADLVIVQSEAVKRVYVNVLTRYTNAPGEYWEEHILALGSPKIDKVRKSKKDDFELPEKWKGIIAGRKVVLYNTGLTTMLEHTNIYLRKIRSVLKMFKSQDEVALWWRPHPLLRSTFHSMHPELLAEFDEIVKNYRQEGWGIYDDTAELDRAVAYTDAYYGDWSSLTQLFKAAGKPVMFESMPRSDETANILQWKLYFANGVVVNDNVYFIPINYSALMVFHMNENRLEHLSWLGSEGCSVERCWLSSGICDLGDRLFLAPSNNEDAYIIDYSGEIKKKIPVSREYVDGRIDSNGSAQFLGTYSVGGRVWMIPHHGRALASCDLENFELRYYDEPYKKLTSVQEDVFPFFGKSVVALESIWILSAQSNQILQFDLNGNKTYSYTIECDYGKITCIEYDGEVFWLYSIKGMLLSWTPLKGVIQRIDNPLNLDDNYGGIKYSNGKIWIVASYQDLYGFYNIVTGEIKVYKNQMNKIEGGILGASLLNLHNDDIFVLPYYGNLLVRISTRTHEAKSWKIEFNTEMKEKFRGEYAKRFKSGSSEWDDEAIYYLMNDESKSYMEDKTENAGRKIYKRLKEI